jgi:anti-anti-sigma regulatory factor
MEITTSLLRADPPVSLMKLRGEINASNYLQVVKKAQELFNNPAPNLIIDLGEVTDITSAGMVGIHKISLIYSGVPLELDLEGEDSRLDDTHSNKGRKYVKLVNPQPEVDKALHASGMKLFFKVFPDLDSALQSF